MKHLKLNNGIEIPVIGLGTYASMQDEVTKAVEDAIDAGYRHIDCAWFYGNEKYIGKAIKSKIEDGTVKREDLFITTKLWNNFHCTNQVVPMLQKSLADLGLSYVDLYLIHWPFGFTAEAPIWPINLGSRVYSPIDYLDTWKGMEDALDEKLTRSIGISNFNSEQITRLLKHCKVPPVVNQIEVNPNINQKKLIEFCKERDIVVVGYCPLGRVEMYGIPGLPKPTILDKKVINIGNKYNKTPAQVILNYLVSLGICIIPKSVRKERIIENFNSLDFTLDKKDICYLDSCNKNKRVCLLSEFSEHQYYPFNIEF